MVLSTSWYLIGEIVGELGSNRVMSILGRGVVILGFRVWKLLTSLRIIGYILLIGGGLYFSEQRTLNLDSISWDSERIIPLGVPSSVSIKPESVFLLIVLLIVAQKVLWLSLRSLCRLVKSSSQFLL